MDPRPFRPTIDGLESRLAPSASPAEVVAAYTRTVETADELYHLGTTLHRGRTSQTISFLATHLPQVALQSRADTATLQEYRTGLQAAVAANPGVLTPALQEFLQQLAGAQVQATFNGVYADVYGIGFGGSPISPPVPPPPPPTGGTKFGPDMSTSTLPFSLTDPNFVARANGVRVWDVTAGTGTTITVGSQFTATYTGYLTSGAVFDSGTLNATTLSTANLIPGFVTGLDGMKVGGTRRIFIPASQGYGSTPRPGIPANSDLVFEVNLVSSP